MPAPLRTIRAEFDDTPSLRHNLTTREIARREKILTAFETYVTNHGLPEASLKTLAEALRTTQPHIRRFFADIHAIFAELLRRYLLDLAAALGNIPQNTPNPHAARRAAYFTFTRSPYGGFTNRHHLLTLRHSLPPDLLAPIETTRRGLALTLHPTHGETALHLLEAPHLTLNGTESLLAPRPPQLAKPKPQPHPTPKPAPTIDLTGDPDLVWQSISKAAKIQARAGP